MVLFFFSSWLMPSYAVQKPGATSPTSKSGSPKAGATVDGFGWKRGEGPKQSGCYHERKRSSTGACSRFLVFVNFWTMMNSFPFCCILVSGWKRITWNLMWVTWHIHKEVMMSLLNCLDNLDFARPKIVKTRQKQSENLWFATHLFVVLISAWTLFPNPKSWHSSQATPKRTGTSSISSVWHGSNSGGVAV